MVCAEVVFILSEPFPVQQLQKVETEATTQVKMVAPTSEQMTEQGPKLTSRLLTQLVGTTTLARQVTV